MVEFNVNKKRSLEIYYNVKERILGRIPTSANLLPNSDNSLYFGIYGADPKMEAEIGEILGISMNTFGNQRYSMNWDNKSVTVETNLNAQGQLQFKINVDGYKSGLRKMITDFTDRNNIDNIDDFSVFLDFKRNKISFHKIVHIGQNKISILASDHSVAMKDVEDAINEINQKYDNIDFNQKNAYVDSLMHVRSSAFQKIYRDRLLKEFKCKCALCNINIKELLVASHIVPYYQCTSNEERVDPNNGLLLCSLHDDLFDKGFISFDDKGKVLFTEGFEEITNKIDFMINSKTKLKQDYLTKDRIGYLKRHKIRK